LEKIKEGCSCWSSGRRCDEQLTPVFRLLCCTPVREIQKLGIEEAGIDLARPDEPDRAWINDIYLGELVHGVFLDATRDRALEILIRLRRDDGIDGLILAGTELSVLLPNPSYAGVPVLNAAAIHVDEGLDWLTA